jgi:hypothetical protein
MALALAYFAQFVFVQLKAKAIGFEILIVLGQPEFD